KKTPFYHLVVSDSRNRRDGRYIERLGFYNPAASGEEQHLKIDLEPGDPWLGDGARPTERVAPLIEASRKAARTAPACDAGRRRRRRVRAGRREWRPRPRPAASAATRWSSVASPVFTGCAAGSGYAPTRSRRPRCSATTSGWSGAPGPGSASR